MLDMKVSLNAEKVKRLLAEAPEALTRAIELASAKLLAEMQQTAVAVLEAHKPHPAVAMGNLARGIQFEVFHRPPLGGMLFVAPPADVYALPVEEGSKPHWIPLAAIANPRQGGPGKDGKPRKLKAQIKAPVALLPWVKQKFPGVAEQEAIPLAFAIRGKIAKRGTFGGAGQGVRFFGKTLKAHEADAPVVYDFFIDQEIQKLGAQQN